MRGYASRALRRKRRVAPSRSLDIGRGGGGENRGDFPNRGRPPQLGESKAPTRTKSPIVGVDEEDLDPRLPEAKRLEEHGADATTPGPERQRARADARHATKAEGRSRRGRGRTRRRAALRRLRRVVALRERHLCAAARASLTRRRRSARRDALPSLQCAQVHKARRKGGANYAFFRFSASFIATYLPTATPESPPARAFSAKRRPSAASAFPFASCK